MRGTDFYCKGRGHCRGGQAKWLWLVFLVKSSYMQVCFNMLSFNILHLNLSLERISGLFGAISGFFVILHRGIDVSSLLKYSLFS